MANTRTEAARPTAAGKPKPQASPSPSANPPVVTTDGTKAPDAGRSSGIDQDGASAQKSRSANSSTSKPSSQPAEPKSRPTSTPSAVMAPVDPSSPAQASTAHTLAVAAPKPAVQSAADAGDKAEPAKRVPHTASAHADGRPHTTVRTSLLETAAHRTPAPSAPSAEIEALPAEQGHATSPEIATPLSEAEPASAARPVRNEPEPRGRADAVPDFGFTNSSTPLSEIGRTMSDFVKGESDAALSHLWALSQARSPVDAIRLQVGEFQRAANASMNCFGAVARSAGKLAGTVRDR